MHSGDGDFGFVANLFSPNFSAASRQQSPKKVHARSHRHKNIPVTSSVFIEPFVRFNDGLAMTSPVFLEPNVRFNDGLAGTSDVVESLSFEGESNLLPWVTSRPFELGLKEV